jgi:hypothetical protein
MGTTWEVQHKHTLSCNRGLEYALRGESVGSTQVSWLSDKVCMNSLSWPDFCRESQVYDTFQVVSAGIPNNDE